MVGNILVTGHREAAVEQRDSSASDPRRVIRIGLTVVAKAHIFMHEYRDWPGEVESGGTYERVDALYLGGRMPSTWYP